MKLLRGNYCFHFLKLLATLRRELARIPAARLFVTEGYVLTVFS
jgi:hypothetical protein